MIPLDLPPQEAIFIVNNAQKQGLSIEQYVMSVVHKDTLGDMLLSDFLDTLPSPKKHYDGLAIQQELRNEWL